MSEAERNDRAAGLEEGRRLLEQASETYGRTLSAEEYWWLGVGLAACTLAELSDRSYAVGRIQQLMDRLGYKGVKGDWLQRFIEELAALDAEGLVWPLYQRGPEGPMEPTGAAVHPDFGPESAYFVALGHLAVALAVHREEQETVARLAGAIGEMVTQGLKPEHEADILAVLSGPEA